MMRRFQNSREASWPLLFATTCYNIWHQWNLKIFEGRSETGLLATQMSIRLAQGYGFAMESIWKARTYIPTPNISQVKRYPPPNLWVKLNTNGLVQQQGSIAACDSIVRNHDGAFMGAFSSNLGFCSITFAELWAIFIDLKSVFQKGFKQVLVETDSKSVWQLLSGSCNSWHPCFPLVKSVLLMMEKDWQVRI